MLIAQISDIHAGPDNDNLLRLEKAIVWLEALRPDCLVVTGDLVDGGWADGYREIGRLLQKMPWPSFILPGNADDIPSVGLLRRQFSTKGYESRLHFSALCGDNTLLIGLDASVVGQDHGEVRNHLPWLWQQLVTHPEKRAILFTHHNVFPSGIKPIDDVMCRDAAALAELLESLPTRVLAVCSGHVHRSMAGLFAGIPAYVCGSICPANPLLLEGGAAPPVTDAPSLMVHELKGARLVSSHVSLT